MRRSLAGLHFFNEGQQPAILHETAIFQRKIDLPQIHGHDTARANIGMAHFGITHLPAGQARIGAMGDKGGVGAHAHDAVKIGRVSLCHCVACAVGVQAPPIKNAQNDRFGHDVPFFRVSGRRHGAFGERVFVAR